jgi:hypothetical protein
MDLLRASRGQGNVDDWPEWCLLPGEAPYAIATANGLVKSEVINMAPVDQMASLYAWLQGKNIWQVDPGVATALLHTDMDVEIPIGSRSIAGMLDDTSKTAQATAERFGIDGAEDTLSDTTEVIRAAIAIAPYSCSRQRDIADPARPGAELARPRVVGRLYQPPRIEVGYRVGAAIRRSRMVRVAAEDEPEAVSRVRVSPHLRAAHCTITGLVPT